MTAKADIRPQLQAIAAGKGDTPAGAALVDEAFVVKHQADFRAWMAFARPRSDEPLTAPAELLGPLP